MRFLLLLSDFQDFEFDHNSPQYPSMNNVYFTKDENCLTHRPPYEDWV